MTIPDPSELQATLDLIAQEMGRVKSQINEINERTAPLRTEQSSIKDKMQQLLDNLNEEVKYATDQEHKVYEIYLECQRLWKSYKESCRQIKAEAEQGLNDRAREIKLQLWDDDKVLKELQREFESLERRWDNAQRRIKDAEAYAATRDRLDRLTMGAPWREWAKDHQIDGGRKIAYRGRLLLGDTMGLGKTLTSVIAMDFIRAMTADADPEHPVVIETN